MNMEITAKSECATSDTLLNATYDFEFDVQTTFNVLSFFFACCEAPSGL